ncbi:MAG: VCBS repeat-containing protein [Sphingobacteriia bacterium]|nr:VCBS repeat-containing protein [Sphingobacteriia bacterium]NCC39435.1 VCBS repeat-containing protein [Gammaproteobacteria bacterium]
MNTSETRRQQSHVPTRIAVAVAVALATPTAAVLAAGLTNVQVDGTAIGYWEVDGNCTVAENPNPADLGAIVQGSNSQCVIGGDQGPGGYVQLGQPQSQVWATAPQRLMGDFGLGTPKVKLESLSQADWTAGAFPNRLVDRYISDAVAANCNGERPENYTFNGTNILQLLSQCFMSGAPGDCQGETITPSPAEYASDPDIAYARFTSSLGTITVGLAGTFDANDVLGIGEIPYLFCPDPANPNNPLQWPRVDPLNLSEVVKLSYSFDGLSYSAPAYLYGFQPTPSGISGLLPWYDSVYEGQIGLEGTVFYSLNTTPWQTIPGSLSQVVAFGRSFGGGGVAGITPSGLVWYNNYNLRTGFGDWLVIPGTIEQLTTGDPGTGDEVLIGLNADGLIYFSNVGGAWENVPGRLARSLAMGSNGDLYGINGLGIPYYGTEASDYATWFPIEGQLETLVVGDFNDDGVDEVVGINQNGFIYYSADRTTWMQKPGALAQLTVGDFNGDGRDDLAGVDAAGGIYYTTNLSEAGTTWTRIDGELKQMIAADLFDGARDELVGINFANSVYYYDWDAGLWTQIEGTLTQIAAGDINGNGFDDLAGIDLR